MRHFIAIILLLICLPSCTMFQNNPEDNRKAMCKELKQRIIFNGATSNQIVATQERAETATLDQNYREDQCN